jgi:hypothetical protein
MLRSGEPGADQEIHAASVPGITKVDVIPIFPYTLVLVRFSTLLMERQISDKSDGDGGRDKSRGLVSQ